MQLGGPVAVGVENQREWRDGRQIAGAQGEDVRDCVKWGDQRWSFATCAEEIVGG